MADRTRVTAGANHGATLRELAQRVAELERLVRGLVQNLEVSPPPAPERLVRGLVQNLEVSPPPAPAKRTPAKRTPAKRTAKK